MSLMGEVAQKPLHSKQIRKGKRQEKKTSEVLETQRVHL